MSFYYLLGYNVLQACGWSAILVKIISYFVVQQKFQGMYAGDVELLLKVFQTAAVLEIVHSAVGIVKSGVMLTAMQVYSRIFLLWGIMHSAPESQRSIGISLLLLAWVPTEIIRYSFYALSLLGSKPYALLWARYTFFIVLYPIGVAGELLATYTALPYLAKSKIYSIELPNAANISFIYYYVVIINMFFYIPAFPQLYGHMLKQRKKLLKVNQS